MSDMDRINWLQQELGEANRIITEKTHDIEDNEEEISALRSEIDRKNNALEWIHKKIVAKSELYNYDEDLLRDIMVITEQALSTKEASDVCKSCKAYEQGRNVCTYGFPIAYAQDIPMCMRDNYSDNTMKRFFDDSGYPILTKEDSDE